jgi:hypothetical protein
MPSTATQENNIGRKIINNTILFNVVIVFRKLLGNPGEI